MCGRRFSIGVWIEDKSRGRTGSQADGDGMVEGGTIRFSDSPQ